MTPSSQRPVASRAYALQKRMPSRVIAYVYALLSMAFSLLTITQVDPSDLMSTSLTSLRAIGSVRAALVQPTVVDLLSTRQVISVRWPWDLTSDTFPGSTMPFRNTLGPKIDNRAPFSGVDFPKLCHLTPTIIPGWPGVLPPCWNS